MQNRNGGLLLLRTVRDFINHELDGVRGRSLRFNKSQTGHDLVPLGTRRKLVRPAQVCARVLDHPLFRHFFHKVAVIGHPVLCGSGDGSGGIGLRHLNVNIRQSGVVIGSIAQTTRPRQQGGGILIHPIVRDRRSICSRVKPGLSVSARSAAAGGSALINCGSAFCKMRFQSAMVPERKAALMASTSV